MAKMMALVMQPDWAVRTLLGYKTIDVRSWRPEGIEPPFDAVICMRDGKGGALFDAHAIAISHVSEIVPMRKDLLEQACMDGMVDEGAWAWIFEYVQPIVPFPVTVGFGQQSIEVPNLGVTPVSTGEQAFNSFAPLFRTMPKTYDACLANPYWSQLVVYSYEDAMKSNELAGEELWVDDPGLYASSISNNPDDIRAGDVNQLADDAVIKQRDKTSSDLNTAMEKTPIEANEAFRVAVSMPATDIDGSSEMGSSKQAAETSGSLETVSTEDEACEFLDLWHRIPEELRPNLLEIMRSLVR